MQIDTTKWTNKIKEIVNNKNKKYIIFTMGCQLNENDSEKISGMLKESGFTKTNNTEEADIIVFNTCCVRENAEERLLGKLGEVKKYKENHGAIIAIGGCMMQEKNMVDKIKKSYPYVDILFGTHTLERFSENLYSVLKEHKKIDDIINIDGVVYEGVPVDRTDKYRASVSIMNGCNNFCTFCIVPYVRGRERSRNPQDIINEIEDLAGKGYKEITLLGQNVNSYLVSQKQKGENVNYRVKLKNENEEIEVNSFATLLRAINRIKGIERIRFISPHPKDFTDDVIDAIRDCENVCKLIHLPLQSGSTRILKLMNRKYTKEQYLNLVKKIKDKIPGATFTTDIIVGFPGENEDDFEETLDVVKKVKFEQIFMFIYSRRKGTAADKMQEQVDEKIKHIRFEKLKELYSQMVDEINKTYIGTTQKILVEGPSKTNEKILTGRTESNKVVNFEAKQDLIGKMIDIKIVSEHKWYLKGKI